MTTNLVDFTNFGGTFFREKYFAVDIRLVGTSTWQIYVATNLKMTFSTVNQTTLIPNILCGNHNHWWLIAAGKKQQIRNHYRLNVAAVIELNWTLTSNWILFIPKNLINPINLIRLSIRFWRVLACVCVCHSIRFVKTKQCIVQMTYGKYVQVLFFNLTNSRAAEPFDSVIISWHKCQKNIKFHIN